MLRSIAIAALAALPLSALSVPQGQGTVVGPTPSPGVPCTTNPLVQEPVLVFDISGFTLTGVLHQHLAVYNNGVASISRVSGGTSLFPLSKDADLAFISSQMVEKLQKDLAAAGAPLACDEQLFVSDIPMTTVTVFRGGTDARAHTFSYWLPTTPQSQATAQVISKFIADVFPNF